MSFIKNVTESLAEKERTLKDLAVFIGQDERTIKIWIASGTTPPADTAAKIADFLDDTVERLVSGEKTNTEAKIIAQLYPDITEQKAALVDEFARAIRHIDGRGIRAVMDTLRTQRKICLTAPPED